jgi:alpha-ketoglutaric semialdehyde dehydrogenase
VPDPTRSTVAPAAHEPHPNYVAGAWRTGAEALRNDDPSDLDTPVGDYAVATPDDVRDAIAAAAEAFPTWSATNPKRRAEALDAIGAEVLARADELGRLLSREEGKTLAEGVGEARRAGELFRYYAAEAYRSAGELLPGFRDGVEVEVRRHPIGVVGVITPWNFPLAIPAWKIAPALAYGNTVVFKPAELVPACAWALAEIVSRAGLPDGAVNLVMGPGDTVGAALVDDARLAGVTFTGSAAVGRRVAAVAKGHMTRVQLELGGKNPLVVLDDADLDVAVECALQGAYFSTGQRCTASSRLIVTRGIEPRFTRALAERVAALRVGHALDPDTEIGPVIDATQLQQDLDWVAAARAEGARAAVLGEVVERRTRGYYLSPTLFVDTDNAMRINREEVFGPVAAVIPAQDHDEALALANDTPYGLVAGIVTTSLRHAAHFRAHAQAGMVMVNLPTAGMDYHAPFGGTKASSYGTREQGTYAREFFTYAKASYVRAGG